jgi:hypothetical protein
MASSSRCTDMSTGWDPKAVGAIIFAAVMMIVGGVFQMVQGGIALLDDDYFHVGGSYAFAFNQTTWGVINLAVGILVAAAGLALLRGATWARGVAVVVAGVSLFTNFVWLPYSPLWSLTTMGMAVLVIWAVTTHGRDAEVMRSGAPSTPNDPRTYA